MTTTEQLYRQALEKIAETEQGTPAQAWLKLYQVRMIARRALAHAAAAEARDPFSGPRGERVRQELLREAQAEGRARND